MLIDIHSHIFPDKIAKKTVEILKAGIKNVQGTEFKNYNDATLSGLEKSMDENNVDISVVLPIVTNIKSTQSINAFAKEINNNKRIVSFGGVHPMDCNCEYVLESLKENGFKGIKLHPEFQNFYIDSPESIKLFKKAEELNLCVVIHSGADIGIPPPVHCTPVRLKNLLGYVSGKNIIAAHLGAWNMWDDVEKHLVGTNIGFDTAFISKFISKEQCQKIILSHCSEKIFFGSDSPWEKPSDTLEFINSLCLNQTDFENITYKNAMKFLNK